MQRQIDKPTRKLVRAFLRNFDADERYAPADRAVATLFQTFPKNRRFEDVLLKVTVLNDLYSTNIYATFATARHICSLEIDKQLDRRMPQVVDRIARVVIGGKPRIHYSFASKYCSWHAPDDYPIFDGFVEDMLWRYRKLDGFSRFARGDLRQYVKYKLIFEEFRKYYKLETFGFKQLDKFLWMYGKKIAPSTYAIRKLPAL